MITIILAETNVSAGQLGIGLAVLTALAGIYLKLAAVKKTIVSEAILQMKAEQQPNVQHIAQPLEVREAEKFTLRSSFDRHAQINREEHQRLEDKAKADLQRLEDKVDDAKREIMSAGEEREGRLKSRIDALSDSVGKLVGKVEEMSKRKSS